MFISLATAWNENDMHYNIYINGRDWSSSRRRCTWVAKLPYTVYNCLYFTTAMRIIFHMPPSINIDKWSWASLVEPLVTLYKPNSALYCAHVSIRCIPGDWASRGTGGFGEREGNGSTTGFLMTSFGLRLESAASGGVHFSKGWRAKTKRERGAEPKWGREGDGDEGCKFGEEMAFLL